MPQNLFAAILVAFLHNLATVVWIGGMFTLGLVVFPVLKKTGGPEQALLLSHHIQKRMRIPAVASLVVLTITGILLAKRSGRVNGPFGFSTPYEAVLAVKHIIVIVMVVLMFARVRVSSKAYLSKEKEEKMKLQKTSFILLFGNIILGAAVLILSTADAVLALAKGR